MSIYHAGNPLPPAKTLSLSPKKRILNWGLGPVCLALKLRFRTRATGSRPRIVVLEPFGMGDIIALEPLMSRLLGAGFHVTLAAQERWSSLFSHLPGIEWIPVAVPWASYDGKAKGGLGGLMRGMTATASNLTQIVAGSVGIDPRGDLRSVATLWRSGCSRVLALSRYMHSNATNPPGPAEYWRSTPSWNKWRSNCECLRLLGIDPSDCSPPRIPRTRPLPDELQQRIGLIPMAPWPGKLWPAEKWRGLAERLQGLGCKPIGFAGPGQSDAVRSTLGEGIPVTECASIAAWCDALQEVDRAVSVDSGPMHIASALGVPVVGLFGGGLLPVWAPSGNKSCVVTHQFEPGFGPCHQIGTNLDYEESLMRAITVDEVSQATVVVAEKKHFRTFFGP